MCVQLCMFRVSHQQNTNQWMEFIVIFDAAEIYAYAIEGATSTMQ